MTTVGGKPWRIQVSRLIGDRKHEMPNWQNQPRRPTTQITGVTERMKKGEKVVKEMTRERFLSANDTARPPQPGVGAEKGSCRRPSTRRKEVKTPPERGKHQTRERTGREGSGLLNSPPCGRGNAPRRLKSLQPGTQQPPNSELGIFRHAVLETTAHVSFPRNLQGHALHQRQRKPGTPPPRREGQPRAGRARVACTGRPAWTLTGSQGSEDFSRGRRTDRAPAGLTVRR